MGNKMRYFEIKAPCAFSPRLGLNDSHLQDQYLLKSWWPWSFSSGQSQPGKMLPLCAPPRSPPPIPFNCCAWGGVSFPFQIV